MQHQETQNMYNWNPKIWGAGTEKYEEIWPIFPSLVKTINTETPICSIKHNQQ